MTQKRGKCGELCNFGFKNLNFAQFLNIFARPHGRTVTAFRNPVYNMTEKENNPLNKGYILKKNLVTKFHTLFQSCR